MRPGLCSWADMLPTCTRNILSCIIPSLSSSLLFSVDSCSRPIKLILPRFWTLPVLLKAGNKDSCNKITFFYWFFIGKPYPVQYAQYNQNIYYSKTCVKRPVSKRPKIGFQDQLLLNTGQKYCRMLQGEHSAILLTFVKLSYVIKIFALSIFEWPFYTNFTVYLGSNALLAADLSFYENIVDPDQVTSDKAIWSIFSIEAK